MLLFSLIIIIWGKGWFDVKLGVFADLWEFKGIDRAWDVESRHHSCPGTVFLIPASLASTESPRCSPQRCQNIGSWVASYHWNLTSRPNCGVFVCERYCLGCRSSQDSSHHQDYEPFLGSGIHGPKPTHLPRASILGGGTTQGIARPLLKSWVWYSWSLHPLRHSIRLSA